MTTLAAAKLVRGYINARHFVCWYLYMFICKYEFAIAAYHVLETKVVMYEQEISPHVSLADIGVTFHDKIPLRSGAQIRQYVRAK